MDHFHHIMETIKFPYYERKSIKTTKLIGSGYIGNVYEGIINNKDCIIKCINNNNYYDDVKETMFYQDVIDEIIINQKCNSNYQIKFYGYSVKQTEKDIILYILMEKTSAIGDLHKYIYQDKFWKQLSKNEYKLSNSNTKIYNDKYYYDYIMPINHKYKIIYAMCFAVNDLHTYNIVHCDLKLNNMLYVNDHIKLIDYNASVDLKDNSEIIGKTEQGTPGYMAKEMYRGLITYSADIYSLGVCILEVWFGDIWPTNTHRYDKGRKYILDYLSLLKNDNPQLYLIVKQCTHVNHTKRPTINKLINSIKLLMN